MLMVQLLFGKVMGWNGHIHIDLLFFIEKMIIKLYLQKTCYSRGE